MKFLIFLSALAGTVWLMIGLGAATDGTDPVFAAEALAVSFALFGVFGWLLSWEARR